MEEKRNAIHFTIDTTKYSAWKDKDDMIRHAMETVEEIKKEHSCNCTLWIQVIY